MNKHKHLIHLSLLVGFFVMTASVVAGQFTAPAGQFNTANSPFNSPFKTSASQSDAAGSPSSAATGQGNQPASPFKTTKPG